MNKRLSFPVWFYVVMVLQGFVAPVFATGEVPNRPPLSEVKALEGFERSVVQEYSIHFGNARLLTGLGSDSGFFGGGDSHEILWEPGVVRLNSGGPGGYAAFFHCLSGADKEERHEMDFLRPFHAAIKEDYQPRVMGAVIRAKGAGPWHVELLRGEGATQQEVGRISFEDYSESEYTETYVDLSGIAEPVKRLTILAADGGDIYLDRLEFVVQLPEGMTETEYAFLVSLAQLLRCHDPQTGLVRDQAQNPIEEGGNRHVTPGLGWVALAAALGTNAGFIEPAAAAALAEQTIGTLLSLPALETGWLPHFTGFDGEGVLVPCPGDKDEYSTIDTALAYLSAYAAAAMLGLEDEQDALYAKIQALDFTAVTNSHGEIHHGFNRDGQLLSSTWKDFGGETLLMVLLGKMNEPGAVFNYEKFPKPERIVYQGNGFILELAPLLLRQFGADPNAGPDACGVDWHALRQELLTAQAASVGTGAFIAGRSSCEIVPDASDTDYLASGAFEYTENWLAPHYAALVSGLDIEAAPDRIAAARSLGFMPVLGGPVESIFYDEQWNLVRVHRVQTALNAWFNTLGYYAAWCLERARENALYEAVAADPALGAAAQALFEHACTPPWFTFAEGSGANLPWMTTPTDQYGWDVGANPWGGDHAGYSTNLENLAADLDRLKDCCAPLVRVFIFCDFRTGLAAAPPSGEFAFDDYVFADMDALVAAAADKGLKLMPVLLDFTLIDGKDREGESDVGEHPEFLTTHKDGFIQLLAAFVERYSDNPTIFAWDLINEPEVAFELAANAGVPPPVSREELDTFLKELITALRAVTDQPLTLGSKHRGYVADWQHLGLDLYQFHYYDDMEGEFPLDYPAADLGLDRPVLVGELEPANVAQKLASLEANGYAGALFWSLNKDYDFGATCPEYRGYFGCEGESEGEGELEGEGETDLGLEADVAPRPEGDGELLVNDWVQVGRFVAGLDTPAPGSEFQRADCAPIATFGDGDLLVNDWVQAGRYVAGLDPAQPQAGPTGL